VAYKGARSSKSEVENRFLRYGCYCHICFHDAESLAGANAPELGCGRNTWRESSGFRSGESRSPFQIAPGRRRNRNHRKWSRGRRCDPAASNEHCGYVRTGEIRSPNGYPRTESARSRQDEPAKERHLLRVGEFAGRRARTHYDDKLRSTECRS